MKSIITSALLASVATAMNTKADGPTYTVVYEKNGDDRAMKVSVTGVPSGGFFALGIGKIATDEYVDALYFPGKDNSDSIKDYYQKKKEDNNGWKEDTTNSLKSKTTTKVGEKYNMSAIKLYDSKDVQDGIAIECPGSKSLRWYYMKDSMDINSAGSDEGEVLMTTNGECEVILADVKVTIGGIMNSIGALSVLAAANYYLF